MAEYESILLVKSEVFVYKIPPRTTNRGYRANEWNLDTPHWTGRMRIVSKGNTCIIKLEDKTSGQLFAQAPIEQYPGIAVESVSDSSRYFVLRIQDDNGKEGRNAFIGIGFADRSDSFDLNVALQDHFKWVQKEQQNEKDKDVPKPGLNLGFKEGETIKINMKITKKDGGESSRSKNKTGNAGGGLGILPPPPGGVKLAPPPNVSREPTPTSSPTHQPHPPPQKPVVDQSNTDWVQF
jgi:hypothetical protein